MSKKFTIRSKQTNKFQFISHTNNISQQQQSVDFVRRRLLKRVFMAAGAIAIGAPQITACSNVLSFKKIHNYFKTLKCNISSLGPLMAPDVNGIRLPEGFTSKIIAQSNRKPVEASGYVWHWAPDGGAVFDTAGGGWIYVSNSELNGGAGGAGALVFGDNGVVRDAYSILENTSRNCGGGVTPWGTWLSCEEVSDGRVWECDPMGVTRARVLNALGTFAHEAVAFDTDTNQLYLTEDEPDGCLYRFTPDFTTTNARPDLRSGVLEVAELLVGIDSENVLWHKIHDPNAKSKATRYQIGKSTAFKGGEGIGYLDGQVYFATKGDNRIWQFDVASQTMTILYDIESYSNSVLVGVDGLAILPTGEIFVAEDGGDMQIVAITTDMQILPIVQVEDQPNSELTGVAFNRHGNKLYFSSQRGTLGTSAGGITYEISGPFYS
ncbi:MAG: DUF839 domain-containing protein [Gammaproteobacteria bacterium]|nr:DUF839 domain-containing protein [Gammaproteobacteria bacterium]